MGIPGLPPIHPGEILRDEIDELEMTPAGLAEVLGLGVDHVERVLSGGAALTAEFALRLGRWLGTGPEIWLNLQKAYELKLAEQTVGAEIMRTVVPRPGSPSEAA